jgi:hypothetical protein
MSDERMQVVLMTRRAHRAHIVLYPCWIIILDMLLDFSIPHVKVID